MRIVVEVGEEGGEGGIVADLPREQVEKVARVKTLEALSTTNICTTSC